MKKVLTILLTFFAVITLFGCKEKEKIDVDINTGPDTIVGGWQEPESDEIPIEAKAAFDRALEGYTGLGLNIVEYLGSQVVAGINYKFLCDATTITVNPETSKKIVTVYKDLQGNCTFTDIQDFQETINIEE